MSNYEYEYKCNKCNKIFSRKYNLERHELKTCLYKSNKLSILNNEDQKQITKCIYCFKLFENESRLNRHLSSTIGNCYKIRNSNKEFIKPPVNIQNNGHIINNQTYVTNNNINNINNTIHIQPVVNNFILAKHGEETISHITKDIMLKILDIESFPEMCTELMRLLYFNKEVPENRNWTIVYPKNKNAGVEFNHESLRFERKKTYNIIDDKFSNMVSLLFDLVQEISRDDIENNNLSKRQKINVNKYCMHYGQLDISKTSKDVYNSIHSLAYNSRKDQMEVWKDNGHSGNHLSLKF
jgi:Zinc finger, C2H2 type